MGRRPRTTEAERHQWIERFRKSGLTQSAFARRHDLGIANLQNWIRWQRLAEPTVQFREVKVTPALAEVSGSWDAEWVSAQGAHLRVRGEAAVRHLIQAALQT